MTPEPCLPFVSGRDGLAMTSSPSRRTVVLGALGATATAPAVLTSGVVPASAAPQQTGRRPDGNGRSFTVAMIPDTQYLFDGEALHPEPLAATMEFLSGIDDLAFVAHLGDVTQNGTAAEFAAAGGPFRTLLRKRIPFSVLAGNHDVNSRTDDRRGPTPYLTLASLATRNRVAKDAGGYNTAYIFTGAGREILLLALDWRLSDAGVAWARSVLADHSALPAIITVHDAVNADGPIVELSDHGRLVWDRLISEHPQVFLSVNGHYWPTGRMTRQRTDGSVVELHLANHQETYYGGAGAVRLYRFDLDAGLVDVTTEVPYAARNGRNTLEREELRPIGAADRFSFPLPRGLAERARRPLRSATAVIVRDTEAYWRFDGSGPLAPGARVPDLSGRGNHLEVTGGTTVPLTRVADRHPDQPSATSLRMAGGAGEGGYLVTVPEAPLNTDDLDQGYTVEAFFHLADPFTSASAWSAILSRWGSAKSAGRIGHDSEEPVATLSISGGRELQWCVYPTNLDRSVTNWGHELRVARWWHVAVVNDARHTTMYVDGCPVVRNPATVNRGLLGGSVGDGLRWAVGAYSWDGQLDKLWQGLIGDIRIVRRALLPHEFMNA